MEEDGESSRVSADSSSWLVGSRQRFTIELRPGETTIVSWKRLVKDAQNTSSSHLTAPKTENSLDERFQDEPIVKQNGLLVNSEKPECINEPVLSVAQQLRKRSKVMAKGQGEKVDGHLPRKHAKLEQGRLNFAATKALLEEESSVLLQDLADTSQWISNDDASISPLNSLDADNHTRVTIHSSNIGNHTTSVATHQNYLGKGYCKQLESLVRESMNDNKEEGISAKVEPREKEATCGELPDLNLPVYPVQPKDYTDPTRKKQKSIIVHNVSVTRRNHQYQPLLARIGTKRALCGLLGGIFSNHQLQPQRINHSLSGLDVLYQTRLYTIKWSSTMLPITRVGIPFLDPGRVSQFAGRNRPGT